MKIKRYAEYVANEGKMLKKIGQWLSKKAAAFGKWLDKAKGAALVAAVKCMLPKWLFDFVANEAASQLKESAIYEEWTLDTLTGSDIPKPMTEEEISGLSDEEYSGWLEQFAGSIKFKSDYGGKILGSGAHTAEQDQALVDLLNANGISANVEFVSANKPSLKNISAKIDGMSISPAAKKVLRIACVILFFGILFLKGTSGMAATAGVHDGDGPGDGKLSKALKGVKGDIKGKVSDIKGDIKGKVSDIKGDIKGKVSDIKGDIKGKVSDIKDDIKDRISDVKDDIEDRISDVEDQMTGKAENFEDIKKRFEEESKKGNRQYGVGMSIDEGFSWQHAFHNATRDYLAKNGLAKNGFSKILFNQVEVEHKTFRKADGKYVTIVLFEFEKR